jgi:drug/metabolite transporter (DMT)-like permease
MRLPPDTAPKVPSRWGPLAAYLAVCVLWGSTYLAIALAIRTIPPLLMVGLRFTTAGVILLSWCLIKGDRLPPKETLINCAVTGILLLYIGNTSVAWVEQYLASGLAAIVVGALPLWMVLLDKKHWKDSFSSTKIILGLLLGFSGVIFLVTAGSDSVRFSFHNTQQLLSLMVLGFGSLSWAAGSLYSKNHPSPGSTVIKVSLQMLFAGVALLLSSWMTGDWTRISWQDVSGRSWAGLIYLVTFGSLVGYLCYIWLLDVWPAARVGTYAYVNPVVAIFLGWSINAEPLNVGQFLGLGIILAGVMLVNSKQFKLSKR